MKKLHTKADNELESKDQKMFAKALVLAGIALAVLFVAALLLVHRAGRHIQPVSRHESSQIALPGNAIRTA